MKPRHAPLLAALVALSALTLTAEGPRLTLEQVFHPTQRLSFLAQPTSRYAWTPDGTLVEAKKETGGVSLWRLEPRTGKTVPVLDSDRVLASIRAAGAAETAARAALASGSFTWSDSREAFLVAVDGALYCVEPARGKAARIAPAGADEATFSPDGSRVAFLRGNDLFAVELASGRETRLTTGGSENRLNGRLDWVYQEEVYGRGSFKGFWWAPDSKRIAYLSLDESRVPTYVLMDDRTQPQRPVATRYPKAGEPNPVARLGVVDLEGRTTWMRDTRPGEETLIVRVGWDPAGRLLACVQDRVQTWLDLLRFEGDASRVLIHEASRAWQQDLPLPRFLKDGGFLWESDRTGFRHVYRYDAQDRLLGALTAGAWDVRKVHGVDEKASRVYFDATERSPIGLDLYRVDLRGKAPNAGLARLTEAPGTHGVTFDPTFRFFLDRWSDARTPARQAVFEASGRQVRMLDAAATPLFAGLRQGQIRFQQVKTRDGFPMETMLVLPPDFDPARKYPVLQEVYGGPGTPLVRDAFGRSTLWYHFLAQQGIVTWICDNRSASAKGVASGFGVHRRLGPQELQDQLDGLEWLRAQGWADMDRLALYGYSYGGFFTSYALTHAKAWKLGVIGAPVTDWRFYDSIYTERYMGLPKDNPEGYEAASVLGRASELTAKVMFIHGTLDDNVHPQNTVQFMDALQKAGRTAPLVLMPGSGHSPRAPQHEWAMHEGIWEFLKQNL